jgi:hypothetical protein
VLLGLEYWSSGNNKSQISNNKQITITKIQNPKLVVLVIGYWNLRFICNLVLVICDFALLRIQKVSFSRIFLSTIQYFLIAPQRRKFDE